jgi:hypothetical protein
MDKLPESDLVPIAPPLKVLDYTTIKKGSGWWLAVVLVESFEKKAVGLYMWQKKNGEWKRKQKFTIHNKEKWALISKAVEEFIKRV